jgi:uncharacterized repeat protein (TIGR01451 family)/fimbrial isopeptide formation D2 family protein
VIGSVNATQAGGPGTAIALNIPADTDILPGCSYNFDLGLTTHNVAPSVATGSYNVAFDLSYNEVDNDAATLQNLSTTRSVAVRKGSVSLIKTAVTPIAGNGNTVDFTVSLLNSGQGGIFNVVLSDVLSSDLTGLVINAPPTPPGAVGPGANQYTYQYIAPGQQVDIAVQATVSVDPNAASCPDLRNDASAVERLGTTSTFFDSVPFDLQNPFIEYTPPNINIPYGAAGLDVTVPVQNTGTGVAKNISLNAANLGVYTIVVNNIASPDWSYAGAGVFNYTGTLAAGAVADLVFNVSTNSCPAPADQSINWVPAYRNACGTDFFPPLRFSSTTLNNIPDVSVAKTVSSGALNIGSPGFYTLTLNGTNTAALPDDGAPDNMDFVVSDTLPNGVTGAVINTVPPTTEVLVNGVPYVIGAPIPDGAAITWRGDRDDLSPLPGLQIDFTAGSSGVCPVGQTITNTAAMNYASCGINNNDGAGFILNENPAGGATTNIVVGGDGSFQAGASDSDGLASTQTREGEHIPFSLSYSFPAGFTGTWAGTSFTADLRSSAGAGVPLVLTNNRSDVHLTITRISDGVTLCDADLSPGVDFSGGDASGPMVVTDFGALTPAGCNALPANMEDHDLLITYAATSPEGNLDGSNNPLNADNVGTYLENTTLTVNAGPLSCLGTTDFIQAANVTIERAVLDVTATLNNGNPVSVCSVVPARIDVAGPAVNTNSDNIFLQFNDTNLEFVKPDGSPGDPLTDLSYSGSLTPLAMVAVRSGNDIQMTGVPNTTNLINDGSVSFNLRLRDTMVPGTMAVQLGYDSNHTSPDGAALTDSDRDYVLNINAVPFQILSGQLKMEFFPSDIILKDSINYAFRAQITNVGTGDAVNAQYRLSLPPGMRFETADLAPLTLGPYVYTGQTIEWSLGDLAAGASVDINIGTSINQTTCFQGVGEDITSETEWGCGSPIITTETRPGLLLAPHQLTLTHDANNSFCELCNEGEIRLFVTNTGSVLLTNVDVSEDLRTSGLTYVPGSTTYFVDGVAMGAPAVDAVVSTGANGPDELINWTSTQIPELANLYSAFSAGPGQPQEIEIRFRVRRNTAGGFDEEGLISADRNIQASSDFGLFCGPPPQSTTSALFEIPIEQPVPTLTKQARNVDANQPDTAYADTVYGGSVDDVIWRVRVTNNGSASRAGLEDLIMNDTIGGNFDIDEICNSEANATLAANGASPGAPDCISAGLGVTTTTSINVDDPFGNPSNDEVASFIDVLEGGDTYIYFVGKIQNTCTNHTNNTDIAWGCEVNPPDGGITTPASNGGVTPVFSNVDSADLSTAVDPAGVLISQTVTGRNPAQPLGAEGIVTVTIRNNSGGSVRGITLDDVLPAGYALDQTLQTAVVTPAFGVYTGMIDAITLTNPQAADENNTSPTFTLSSSGGAAPQNNLLRHGDVLRITLGIVKVTGFDLVADPEVRVENTGDGTDPSVTTPLNNQITVVFENTCSFAFPAVVDNLAVTPAPQDLDVDINPTNANLIYILSDPTASLSLDVQVTNNGGHDATDYFTIVTTGNGLNVTAVPTGCGAIGNPPPPRAVWLPALPATATLYQCSLQDPLPPGQTDSFIFTVQKQGAGADLTFRADVVAEITLSDGTPLSYPPPDTATIVNTANNYSLDSIRARLIGFNLTKVIQGNCSENNPAPINNNRVHIGEDCTFRLEAGWFGFATPGFGSIQIQNAEVTDTNPDGIGFISQDTSNSSAGITSITTVPAVLAPLSETNITWQLNNFASDETFSVDLVSRALNDALNSSGPPNAHPAVRSDVLNASFDVDFGGTVVTFDSTTPGYPPVTLRRASVRIIEPNLIVTKEVCDESIYGIGPACTNFVPLVNEGDTNDDYVYRISILNEATFNGFQRAPAYDVDITDVLDPSDLLTLAPFASDGLDNDGDGVGTPDEPDEALIGITDNTPNNGTPGVVTISSANSLALQKIDPGTTVTLYYRANPDDAVAPGQQLLNSVTASYDTLPGVSGNQNAPQEASGTAGGAREYTTAAQSATIEITALIAPPDSKGIINLSHTALGGVAPFIGPQDVVVGEEIEYQLKVEMPVANLNNFVIRDELPAGIRCVEAQTIDLNAPPYSTAGFVWNGNPPDPGPGPFVPTCTSTGTNDFVEWNFGNQQLTTGPTFDFTATFIARVENTANTNEGDVIRNGGIGPGSTQATLSYTDAGGNPVVINMGPADITVREPVIVLDKTYAVASADADDVLTVTVTATNNGTSPAYNLNVFDDLDAVANLTYIAGSNSANVSVDTASQGINRPIFSMVTPAPIAPGGNFVFTFNVLAASVLQPLEILDNTIQAAWTSLPDDNVALNSGGTIAADGSAMGMRNGVVPGAGDLVNDYEATFTNNTLTVPPVVITKTDLNPAAVSTIGERKQFQLDIAIPEGTTNGLKITDDLFAASGLPPSAAYILENNASFDITYSFSGIATINSATPSEAAFTAFPADAASGVVTWDVGTVVTNRENDAASNAINPSIRITYYARINNDISTDAGDAMLNAASTEFTDGELGGPATSGPVAAPQVNVQEPLLIASKTFSNVTPGKLATDLPDGGDTIEYLVTLTNTGTSTAYDVNIVDTLPPELQLEATPAVILINGVATGVVTPDGGPAGPLIWGRGKAVPDESLDIPAGQSLLLTYYVTLQDVVLANLAINNSVLVDWTSLDGVSADERTGANCPTITAPNDYCTGPVTAVLNVSDNNAVIKTRLSDTSPPLTTPDEVRIGDIVDYELRVNIQEGTSPNVVVRDDLPQGLAFEQVVSVNGAPTAPYAAAAPFTYDTFGSIPATNIAVAGNPASGPSSVTWTLGTITNAADNNAANDELVIVYRARVLNLVHPQVNAINLSNTANLDYSDANGAAPTKTDSEAIIVRQPDLSVTKIAAPANGDNIIDAGEMIDYIIDIINNGTAPAYDTELRDIIPIGLRNGAATITMLSTELPVGNVVANLVPVYSAVTGDATWNFDTGVADAYTIQPGDTLRIVYRVQADATLGPGLTMTNAAQVQFYYSFDDEAVPVNGVATGVREIYGPSNIASATVITPAAGPLDKQNPVNLNASIGEPFSYRITVPAALQSTALNDVRILDDLGLSAADMVFVSVAAVGGPFAWTPVNVGSASNIIIQDSGANGIDIPANQQITIDLTVQLRNQPVNSAGLLFNNTASYTFNMVDGDNGTQGVTVPVTTGDMVVVEPDLYLTKTGPAPAFVQFGNPIPYRLEVENVGTGPAHDITLRDRLPNVPDAGAPQTGGTCDATPNNFVVQITDDALVVLRTLVQNVDYTVAYTAAPTCELVIRTTSSAALPNAVLAADERMVITYDAFLDVDTMDNVSLTNIAGVSEWFSADTAGAGATGETRTYTRTITNGTVGTFDHEDAATVQTQSPVLQITKSVFNAVTGLPVTVAEPGNRLRYEITITNTGPLPATNFDFTDEPDRLNGTAYFAPNTISAPAITPAMGGPITTNPVGGTYGSGLISISNLTLDAAGGANDSVTISFEIDLIDVITSGTIVSNQAEVDLTGFSNLLSDDTNFPGAADPTIVTIGSAPVFLLQKTSQDLTSDPNVLRQGETLRYTITAKNIGVENSVNTVLRDQIPANSAYLAGTTTLNGVVIADPATGVSALQNGILIHAPEDTTPGNMRAEAAGTTNIATITFDVIVDADVVNGTVISNQAFVTGAGAGSGPFPSQPSDDPGTDIFGDPTQDVVGNLPILDVQKTVTLLNDALNDGIVDTGDTLRYTFNISNAGAIPGTGVVLRDSVPTNSTYIANTVTLNGSAITDAVPGTSPLLAGLDISSADLTPPLPTPGNGQMTAGGSATVTLDVTVTGASGQLITNQGNLSSNELPDEPSDADGNDENGDQPTVIAIGNAQQLAITKEVQVVGGGVARAGGQLEYIIRVENVGTVPVNDVLITDDLALPIAGQKTYVSGSAQMNGSSNGVAVAGSLLTADYGTTYGVLDPGSSVTVSFTVNLNAALTDGSEIDNTGNVSWNAATQTASDNALVDIGSAPGIAVLNGTAWHDANFNNLLDSNERLLENWGVEIYLNSQLLDTVFTAANGRYRIIGLTPSSIAGGEYQLRYLQPGAGGSTALLGLADSSNSAVPFSDSLQRISGISVGAGSNTFNLNLPIDPDGVVYDAVLRTPVPGATLTMVNASNGNLPVPASCFDDPAQQNQITGADGYYKFDMNFSVPGNCNVGASYVLQITPPATGYVGTTSVIIPPARALTDPPFSVETCPGSADDQLSTVPDRCEIQNSEFAPVTSIVPRTPGTNYYLQFTLGNSANPYTSQIFNNHIPLDPDLGGAIAISKTSALLNVTRSQLVPYTITLNNTLAAPLQDLDIVDNFPAGFKYIAGSARIDNVPTEPVSNGLQLTWPGLSLNTQEVRTIKLLLVVGSGVGEGDYVNLAQAINSLNAQPASEQASATVRVIPDPTFDCSDIIGKVFDDKNLNGVQDNGEQGLASARVVSARGIEAKTDQYGRFHITCAVVPNRDRGSNYILKLDERSLPAGYRMTTENPRVQRATRGKMLKYNFGATIHHVVRLDMADAVFDPGTTKMRPQWISRLGLLMEKLIKGPSILRLSYLGDVESASLVEDRLQVVKDEIKRRWADLDCCYQLEIETEVFWRRGKPASKDDLK